MKIRETLTTLKTKALVTANKYPRTTAVVSAAATVAAGAYGLYRFGQAYPVDAEFFAKQAEAFAAAANEKAGEEIVQFVRVGGQHAAEQISE